MIKDNLFKWTSLATVLLANVFAIYLIYLIWPREVLEIKVQPYPILQKEIRAGENIVYHTSRCKYYSITPTVSRIFIYDNGQVVNLSSNTAGRPLGCYDEDMILPTFKSMPVGCGYVEINSKFQVNVLQTVEYSTKTEKICIIK